VEDAFASYAVAYLSSVNSSRGLSKDVALKNGADEESALPDDIRYAPDYFLDSFLPRQPMLSRPLEYQ
jgi:hypothetical protein